MNFLNVRNHFGGPTLIYQRYNSVNHILNSQNSQISYRKNTGIELERYFTNIFSNVWPNFPFDLQGLVQPIILAGMNQKWCIFSTFEEVQKIVLIMGKYKSSGPKRMCVFFYKHYWGMIGEVVVSELQNFFSTKKMKKFYNHSFITLVPKYSNAVKVEMYRTIVLCNVFYKIIIKILGSSHSWSLLFIRVNLRLSQNDPSPTILCLITK